MRRAEQGQDAVSTDQLVQSADQVAAAGGRTIRWYFAEPETFARAVQESGQRS